MRLGAWTLHHLVCLCQEPDCGWSREWHTAADGDPEAHLAAARRHSRATGHYVQVERGQHTHYRSDRG